MRVLSILAGCALLVCGCDRKASDPTPPPSPTVPSDTRADDEWPSAPTKQVTDRIDDVAFALTLPSELQGHPNDRTETSRGWEVLGWPLTQPRFEVTLRGEPGFTTVEAGLAAYADDDDVVVASELTDGRFTLIIRSHPEAKPNDAFVAAYVIVGVGARSLECFATHGGAHLTKPELIGRWLATTCGTLQLGS